MSNLQAEVVKAKFGSDSRPSLWDTVAAWVTRQGWIILPLGIAALLGWSAAQQQWLVLLALVVALLAFLWPVTITLGAFAFLVPVDNVNLIGWGSAATTLTYYVGAAAGAALVGMGLLRRKLERPMASAFWWSLLIAWGGASAVWALEPGLTLQRLPTALGLLLLYVASTSVRISRKEFSWIALLTIAGGCAVAAYSTFQYYHGVYYRGPGSGRGTLLLEGKEVDPNVLAAGLFLPISFAIGRFLEGRSWFRRSLSLAALALMGFDVLLTMSRGALIGLATIAFVYFRSLGLNRRMLIPILIIFVGLAAVPGRFFTRLESAESSAGSGRLYIWQAGVGALKQYGLFGAGLENFRQAYSAHVGEAAKARFYSADAHNIYLSVWVELGIVGLALLLLALGSALRTGRQVRSHLDKRFAVSLVACEAAAWAMVIASFFLGMLWRKSFWLVWIMLALAVRVAKGELNSNNGAAELSRYRFRTGPSSTHPVMEWAERSQNTSTHRW